MNLVPDDKPKSLIAFLGALLLGLLVFLPLAIAGLWIEEVMVFLVGLAGIAATWLPAAYLALFFAASLYAGKYRVLHHAPWREQVW